MLVIDNTEVRPVLAIGISELAWRYHVATLIGGLHLAAPQPIQPAGANWPRVDLRLRCRQDRRGDSQRRHPADSHRDEYRNNPSDKWRGFYSAPALAVGHYEVKVSARGFRPLLRKGIELRVDDHAEINFRLEVGTAKESIQVSADAPLVDTSRATAGKVIESTRIDSLPINGRSTLALVVQTPNVRSQAVNSGGFADRGSVVSSFSVNGGPPGANNIVIDGSTN